MHLPLFSYLCYMNVVEFIQWCFRTSNSTLVSLIVLSAFAGLIVKLAKIIKGCDCENDEDGEGDE